MSTLLSLSEVHPRDRIAYWHDVACKAFVGHECRVASPATFSATIGRARLGELGFVTTDSRGLDRVERTARDIARGDDDVFLLCVQLHGSSTLRQDGRETVIHPGDFALLDAQRPYLCHYGHRRQITVKIPHRSLKARVGSSANLTARAVRGSDGIGGLTTGYVKLIPERVGALQPAAQTQIAEHVLDLAALALATAGGEDRLTLSSGSSLTLLQLRMAIETRLSDPGLDSQAAAAAAGISVRYANALLSAQGTSLERLIVSRRLDHCRRALEDPAQSHRAIGEIAYAWGFANHSHFNRRFKAEFGCSPSDYRRGFQV
jgi:AraC-like DNA-binding protein